VNKYVFVTSEGTTYQQNSVSIDPDIYNLQVIGFGNGNNPKEALNNLLEENQYLLETSYNEIFAIQLSNDVRHYFSLTKSK
jgi:hypothetical protein